jgi:hypothetical protein
VARAAAVIALLLAPLPAAAARPRLPPPAPVAAVRIVDGSLEHERERTWTKVDREFKIAPGEGLRTSADGVAVMTFPWMHIVVGGGSVVGLTPSTVLSATLEQGWIEEQASAGDILKVVTAEAEVRGRGDVVVSRSDADGRTRVSVLHGWFRVKARRGSASLDTGQGAVIGTDAAPEIVDLPAPPDGLTPGSDPRYVEQGRTVRLAWNGSAKRYRVNVLSLGAEEIVLSREVAGTSVDLAGRGLGTYQWRVSSIDDAGVQGPPSAPGLVCVVEK